MNEEILLVTFTKETGIMVLAIRQMGILTLDERLQKYITNTINFNLILMNDSFSALPTRGYINMSIYMMQVDILLKLDIPILMMGMFKIACGDLR